MSLTSSPQVSSGQFSMELLPLANKPVLERKAASYAEVVKNLNNARERSFPFKMKLVRGLIAELQKSIQEIAKALTGSLISLKVIQADQENRKLIFSEKEAMWYQQINAYYSFQGCL
ncbi:Nuclear pore complex protein NUP93B [Camellia lanceoleosa]|nr:Nuclear pore complex protein NUP93B [Camellia lanceoleosa]